MRKKRFKAFLLKCPCIVRACPSGSVCAGDMGVSRKGISEGQQCPDCYAGCTNFSWYGREYLSFYTMCNMAKGIILMRESALRSRQFAGQVT